MHGTRRSRSILWAAYMYTIPGISGSTRTRVLSYCIYHYFFPVVSSSFLSLHSSKPHCTFTSRLAKNGQISRVQKLRESRNTRRVFPWNLARPVKYTRHFEVTYSLPRPAFAHNGGSPQEQDSGRCERHGERRGRSGQFNPSQQRQTSTNRARQSFGGMQCVAINLSMSCLT